MLYVFNLFYLCHLESLKSNIFNNIIFLKIQQTSRALRRKATICLKFVRIYNFIYFVFGHFAYISLVKLEPTVPRMLESVPKHIICNNSKPLSKSLVPVPILGIGPITLFRILGVFGLRTKPNRNRNNQKPKIKIFCSVFDTEPVILSLETVKTEKSMINQNKK